MRKRTFIRELTYTCRLGVKKGDAFIELHPNRSQKIYNWKKTYVKMKSKKYIKPTNVALMLP